MTEIKIEKKKRKRPWILLLIITLIFIAYYLLLTGNKEEIAEAIKVSNIEEAEVNEPISIKEDNVIVAAYVAFIDAGKEMDLEHAYTHEALLRLADATQAIAGAVDYVLQVDLGQVREIAAFIQVDKFDTMHADSIRVATDIITTELSNIQVTKYPGLKSDIVELSAASAAINPTIHTLDQKDAVKLFFREAAELLVKMN
jgi:cbb3-type cytochrome oxidase subunit 3